MIEIWKDVKGYEGYYQVSNKLRVKDIRKDRILTSNTGHAKLHKDGEYKVKTILQLYKQSFRTFKKSGTKIHIRVFNLPGEIWKDIEGYEGIYAISNCGRIIRNYAYKSKLLKGSINNIGYKQIDLHKDGKSKLYLVHRLVALAFIPNPNNYPIINHKDENPSNNHYSNLEWCTQKYNLNYGTCREKMRESSKGKYHSEETIRKISKSRKGKNNPNAKPVLMFTKDGKFIRRFDCVADANEYLGKDKYSGTISECCKGKFNTMYGYRWKYEE